MLDFVKFNFVYMSSCTLGNIHKAYDYCRQLHEKGIFVKSLIWQQCALAVMEVTMHAYVDMLAHYLWCMLIYCV